MREVESSKSSSVVIIAGLEFFVFGNYANNDEAGLEKKVNSSVLLEGACALQLNYLGSPDFPARQFLTLEYRDEEIYSISCI